MHSLFLSLYFLPYRFDGIEEILQSKHENAFIIIRSADVNSIEIYVIYINCAISGGQIASTFFTLKL
jgi:hypothetical protein